MYCDEDGCDWDVPGVQHYADPPSTLSTRAPSIPLGRKSTSIKWFSVPPETSVYLWTVGVNRRFEQGVRRRREQRREQELAAGG